MTSPLFPYSARTLQDVLDITERAAQRLFVIGHAPSRVLARVCTDNGWTPRAAELARQNPSPAILRMRAFADVLCGEVDVLLDYGTPHGHAGTRYILRGSPHDALDVSQATIIRTADGFYHLSSLRDFLRAHPRIERA